MPKKTLSRKAKKAVQRPVRKASVRAAKTPAARAPKPVFKAGEVSCVLDCRAWTWEAVLGAAFLMTDRSFATLEGDKARKVTVTLAPKAAAGAAGLKALWADFAAELETQKVRWAIARNNLPVREHVAELAVLLAHGQGAEAPAASPEASEELTDEQRKEIEKLIAEVEDEIRTINQKKAPADPKGIAMSWEEKQAKPAGGAP